MCQAEFEVQFFLSVIQLKRIAKVQIKNFLPTTPLSPYDPTNREACHFRIIPKSFTYKN